MKKIPEKYLDIREYIDDMQSNGKYWFSKDGIITETGLSELSVMAVLRRLLLKKRLFKVRQGFYVIVPLEYRQAGAPPASWFIDSLMDFLNQPYYVSLLSAASFYGASHQQPLKFQVITDSQVREIRLPRSSVHFFVKKGMVDIDVEKIKTETGTMSVSSREDTALDLVSYIYSSGSLGNVATVLGELGEQLSTEKLFSIAKKTSTRFSTVQRFGFIMEELGFYELVSPLASIIKNVSKAIPLMQKSPPEGIINKKWKVIENDKIEVDI